LVVESDKLSVCLKDEPMASIGNPVRRKNFHHSDWCHRRGEGWGDSICYSLSL